MAHHAWKQHGMRWATAAAAVALLLGVLLTIDFGAFAQYAGRLSSGTLAAAFAAYGAQNVFRALRYRALLGRPDLPLAPLTAISLYHNGMVRLLPFKLGEATYVVLMQRRFGVRLSAGITSLLWSRGLELVVILAVAALALLLTGDLPLEARLLVLGLAGSGVGMGVIVLHSPAALRRLLWAGEARLPLLRRISPAVMRLLDEVEALREPRRLLGGLLWSCGTYGSTFLTSLVLLNTLGIALTFHEFVIVISLGMFATAFPFNISGFGLVEWSLAFGLARYVGLPLSEATALGLLLNGFQQIAAFIWGGIGFAVLRILAAHRERTL
ncbi:MAG: lysylphosphatidylglycerol synthase transmembrane domain-containing protein [Anaerolineae bacterium]